MVKVVRGANGKTLTVYHVSAGSIITCCNGLFSCTFKGQQTESKSINMDLQNLLNHKTKVLGGLLSHASGGISEFVLDTAHKTQIHALEFMPNILAKQPMVQCNFANNFLSDWVLRSRGRRKQKLRDHHHQFNKGMLKLILYQPKHEPHATSNNANSSPAGEQHVE
ncbi:hypothetical protein JHK86_056681 [Glycine max]|nr:hypothetical protein JHK86_056681 [Glycine max]